VIDANNVRLEQYRDIRSQIVTVNPAGGVRVPERQTGPRKHAFTPGSTSTPVRIRRTVPIGATGLFLVINPGHNNATPSPARRASCATSTAAAMRITPPATARPSFR